MSLLQRTPHTNGTVNGKEPFKRVVIDVLVIDLLPSWVLLVAVISAHNGIFPALEVVQTKDTNVDGASHAVPLKQRENPQHHILTFQRPLKNELEEGP